MDAEQPRHPAGGHPLRPRRTPTVDGSWTRNNLVYVDAPVDEALGLRRAEAMIVFTAGLPGSLYLYQGEELGLPEVLDIPADRREDPLFVRTERQEIGRDGCRIPLPWTADRDDVVRLLAACRTTSRWLPLPDGWGRYAAGRQDGDPSRCSRCTAICWPQRRALDPAAPLEWVLARQRRAGGVPPRRRHSWCSTSAITTSRCPPTCWATRRSS